MDIKNMTLLSMTLWTIYRMLTTYGVKKSKMSNTDGIKTCWSLEHIFLCLTILFDATFKIIYSTIKAWFLIL